MLQAASPMTTHAVGCSCGAQHYTEDMAELFTIFVDDTRLLIEPVLSVPQFHMPLVHCGDLAALSHGMPAEQRHTGTPAVQGHAGCSLLPQQSPTSLPTQS